MSGGEQRHPADPPAEQPDTERAEEATPEGSEFTEIVEDADENQPSTAEVAATPTRNASSS